LEGEWRRVIVDDATPSVMESDEVVAEGRPRPYGGANRGIETGAVTAARQ
jgi:hypothetical protein